MAAPTSTVTFLPANITITANRGDTLLDAALDHGIPIEHECGGNCSCTTCHVVVEEGWENLSPVEYPEDERLDDADNRSPKSRLACQALIQRGFVTVRIAGSHDARRIWD
jgi:2Fe-2S ferredoxin